MNTIVINLSETTRRRLAALTKTLECNESEVIAGALEVLPSTVAPELRKRIEEAVAEQQ